MADIHWIKLKTGMFDDEKIRLIEAMPEADAILIIWIKLLVLAGKTNDSGLIYIQRDMAYSDEMLATLFNKKINIVRLAISTLQGFDMIHVEENGVIGITNWEKHQNIEGMEKIRIQQRERTRKYRERQKAKKSLGSKGSDEALPEPKTGDANGNVTVTEGNGTESDTETESETESEKEEVRSTADAEQFDWKAVITYLNQETGKHYRNTDSNKRVIVARHKEGFSVEDMKTAIDNQCRDWLNKPKMIKYLRPETLFRASKFEGYLNNMPRRPRQGGWFD